MPENQVFGQAVGGDESSYKASKYAASRSAPHMGDESKKQEKETQQIASAPHMGG